MPLVTDRERNLRSIRSTLANVFTPLVYLSANWISRIGIVLVTAAGVSWLFALPANLAGSEHPYIGLLTVFVLPAIFLLGLALIPLGIKLKAKREGGLKEFPEFRWNNPDFLRLLLFVGIATVLNVIFTGHFTYTAVEYMDSTKFCGASCHIMNPEYSAYKVAAHSQVPCVECHIGEGSRSYVEAKLNGAKQLLEVLTHTYKVPVPTPVHNLAQGHLTCAKCHSDRDFGAKRWEAVSFAEDQANSATRTVLSLAIGGGQNPKGAHGAHMAKGAKIEYRSSPDRKEIEWVRYVDPAGKETIFARAGASRDAKGNDKHHLRTMDCTDCHNRAAHSFEDPSRALDRSMAAGRVDHTLPGIKALGLKQLREGGNVSEALRAHYQSKHPEIAAARGPAIVNAALEIETIRDRNVFPEFAVDWGTHPNFLGHNGCFRCHNSDLVSQDASRRTITQDCTACHRIEKKDEPVAEPVRLQTTGVASDSGMPQTLAFFSSAGQVPFDHAKHLSREKGECAACHDKYFAMDRSDLRYKANVHRTAEAAKTSCAGCHVQGGKAFASAGHCGQCHTGLSEPVKPSLVAAVNTTPVLPGAMYFDTTLGKAAFDHKQHVDLAKGDCTSCHNKLFPMAKQELNYKAGLHKVAEAAKTSCAGCHAPGGSAFAAQNNCARCHSGLGTPKATPRTGVSGLPDARTIETKLGPAKFDHAKHVTLAKNNCQSCHNAIFPLSKGMMGYADNLHRTAEQNHTSCGACHRDGGGAFASKDNCLNCHTELKSRGPIAALQNPIVYTARLGAVAFDHAVHVKETHGDCGPCHSQVFAMARKGLPGYAADYHRLAEAKGQQCGACHAQGKSAFATLNNCRKCHQGLELSSAQ
ncbi:hypothetical protein F183_A31070 [Bryobacterales bacterium F-183]|nr:hypothetical protein F183_A31070 [Bryobacterales bacterium F-183]